MKRGGTFPRWRWKRTCFNPDIHVLGTAQWGGTLLRVDHGEPWSASVGNAYTGPVSTRRFSSRCDAKRWCERMLATGGEA